MMKNLSVLLSFYLMSIAFLSQAQSSLYATSDPAIRMMQRYNIRQGAFSTDLYSDIRPYYRYQSGDWLKEFEKQDIGLSSVDRFNIEYMRADNLTWTDENAEDAQKPVFRYFYRSKANLYQANVKDLNLYVNPALYVSAGYTDASDEMPYRNTRAVIIRGDIAGKVGFYSRITENQMELVPHLYDFYRYWGSYPGAHLTKPYGVNGVDFFQAQGYFTFNATPYINFQFGQDRNFIGSGLRSLLLSDFATDYLFLKINTRIWRFNYMNLFARLTDRYGYRFSGDKSKPYPAKYLAAHYLSINILKNLRIGLFESVTFHDNNHDGRGFDLNYLNPIIFYRSVEHQLGDPDKVMVGLNLDYLPVKNVQLYAQLMFNEFRIHDLIEGNGSYANKYGYQLGAKYVDIFGVSNLDLQLEYNRVRPYSYTHYTMDGEDYPVNSYSHYNQPLAHPLGANFSEFIIRIEAQPYKRFTSGLEVVYADYGADSSNSNWGHNIFLDYRDYEREYDNVVGQGVSTDLLIAQIWFSYQFRHNLFADLDIRYRDLNSEMDERDLSELYIGASIRLNFGRELWNF